MCSDIHHVKKQLHNTKLEKCILNHLIYDSFTYDIFYLIEIKNAKVIFSTHFYKNI